MGGSSHSNQFEELAKIPQEFFNDGFDFIRRCEKPDQKSYASISKAVFSGFVLMGAIGYVMKLIHIPINNFLVGGQ